MKENKEILWLFLILFVITSLTISIILIRGEEAEKRAKENQLRLIESSYENLNSFDRLEKWLISKRNLSNTSNLEREDFK